MTVRRVILAFLWLLSMNAAFPARAADLLSQFHPYINLKEEYNDNLYYTSTNKIDDYITTVQPGIRFSNLDKQSGVNMYGQPGVKMDKQSGVSLDYALGAVFYGKNSGLDYISHNASLYAQYLTSSHINFYLKESFIRSDNPIEREYFTTTEENRYMLTTLNERRPYWRNVVAPTIEYQFGSENRLGVTYRNNIYRTGSANSVDSREDYINPFFSYWFDKRNGFYLEYGRTYGAFGGLPDLRLPDLTGDRASARYTNRFSPRASAFAEYTYSKRTFDSSGPSDPQFSSDYDIHEPGVGMAFAISPTLTGFAQVGYFWKKPTTGSGKDGPTYRGALTNTDQRTTYTVSVQGGYMEGYFAAQSFGLIRYHRLTGSLNHKLAPRLSIGCLGSVEQAEYDTVDNRKDTIWGIGATASYMPLKWLTFALEATHRERQSSIDLNDYTGNRALVTITATY